MTLVGICKKLMKGEQVDGYSLKGQIFSDGERFWQIRPTLNTVLMTEIPNPDTIPYVKTSSPYHKSICRVCGVEIVCKTHKTICRDCAKMERIKNGTAEAKVCIECGETFYIDYYDQRVLNKCRKCRNKGTFDRAKRKWVVNNHELAKEIWRNSKRKSYWKNKINQNNDGVY